MVVYISKYKHYAVLIINATPLFTSHSIPFRPTKLFPFPGHDFQLLQCIVEISFTANFLTKYRNMELIAMVT